MLIPAIHKVRKDPSFSDPVSKDYLNNEDERDDEEAIRDKNVYKTQDAKNVMDAKEEFGN